MDLDKLKSMSKEAAFAWASSLSGVPADVLDGLWAAESERGTKMRSPAGARGHFQLMPHTQGLYEKQLGVKINPDDFHESLYVAAHHLRDDMRREKGDVTGALRAYNNGPNWRTKLDPRGENAAYAGRVLGFAGRKPEAVQTAVDNGVVSKALAREAGKAGTSRPLLPAAEADAAAALGDEQRKQDAQFSDLVIDKFGDARENGAKWVLDMLDRKSQQDFDYYGWQGRADLEKTAQTPAELRFMRENMTAPENGQWVQDQLAEYRARDKRAQDYGLTEQFGASAIVGAADPVGWAIGLGAGKLATAARLGTRTYALGESATRGGLALRTAGVVAGEGVLGNVGFEAFQDATGQVKTLDDYLWAAGFGAGFAAPFVPSAIRRAIDEVSPTATSHVEAFRAFEAERLSKLDQSATNTSDPARHAAELHDIVNADRVGGTTRRAADKVFPDELLARSVDQDPLDAVDPVVAKARVDVQPEPPQAAQAGAGEAAPAPQGEGSPAPAAATVGAIKPGRVAELHENVRGLQEELSGLLQSNGSRPRGNTAKGRRFADLLTKEIPAAREAALRAYELQKGDLHAPRTEGLDATVDGSFDRNGKGTVLQPVAEESLLDALLAARNSIGHNVADLRGLVTTLLHSANLDTLKKTTVRYHPSARGVYRRMDNEIVTAGDAKGAAGMNAVTLRVLVHEAFHATTSDLIAKGMAGKLDNSAQTAAFERLKEIFTEFNDELAKLGIERQTPDKAGNADYAGTNLHEFVSQAMMNGETQRILSSMRGKKYGPPSLWDKLWDTIVDFLGLKADKGTALYDTVKQIEVLVRTQGNLPDNVTLREPELRAGSESAATRSTRDSNFFDKLYAHAESWNTANPVDAFKLETLANKHTSGAVRDTAVSDGLKLASSKNAIARMIAGLVVETTTGAAGRRTTASMLHHLYHHRIIGAAVNLYDDAALSWVKANGGGWMERLTRGKLDQKFHALVYEEILNRRYGRPSTPNGQIKAAADAMQGLFQRSLDQQKRSGTLGSAWLPDDAVGYVSQSLKGDAMRQMQPEERAQMQHHMAQHWAAVYGWDPRFASEFAHHYMVRAQREAAGERHVDHVATNGATSVVKDVLTEMRLEMRSLDARTAGELERVGAAPYAKHRLDLPLLDVLPNGKRLMDYFDTDVPKLARSHARSVAGQAALAERNILGQRGVNNLLRAMREAPVGQEALPEEIHAAERTFGTFLGTPWAGEHRNRLASGLGGFTRLRLMGGLAFTQLGELVNGVHSVGMSTTLEAITSLPRMIGEVKDANNGKSLANAWLGSVDQFSGMALGTEGYRMSSAFDAPDDLLREYGKGSNVVERAIASGNHLQGKISFHRGLLAAQHRAFAERIVVKAADYLTNKNAVNDRYLDDMGFNKDMRVALRGVIDAAVERDAAGNAVGLDIYKFDNVELMEDFVSAVNRGTAQIIQGSFIGEQGAWAHSDLQKLALQLRTFGLTATEKQWARNRMLAGPGVEGYAYAAGVLLAQMAFVTPIYLARLQVNAIGRDDREEYIKQGLSPAAMLQATMNYSANSGLVGDAFDAAMTIGGGWNDDLKESMGTRGGQSGVSGMVPGLGTVDQGLRQMRGDGSVAQSIKLLPGSNLPYVQAVINVTR